MRKVNKQKPQFSLILPEKYDAAGQLIMAYRNLGFTEVENSTDPEGGYSIINFRKNLSTKTIRENLKEALEIDKQIESWLEHLYGAEFNYLRNLEEQNIYWRYLINVNKNLDLSEEEDLNKVFGRDTRGPHIRVEQRDNSSVIRLKEGSFLKLSARLRVQLGNVLRFNLK